MARTRWPRWVYGQGNEPDPRFTFANERTFLAWIRTSLGLSAAGIAVHSLANELSTAVRDAVALGLVVLGVVAGGWAFIRWTRSERALRVGAPLPGITSGAVISAGLLVVGGIILVDLLIRL